MFADHPVLTVLGRRGRGAIVDAILADAAITWTVRGLSRAANVPAAVAARAAHELEALGAIEMLRPGRNAHIRWRPDAAAAQTIAQMVVPPFREAACRAFVQAIGQPGNVEIIRRWQQPEEHAADPLVPTRIAVICQGDVDAALDAVGPALDGVQQAGLPAPDVTVIDRDDLDAGDALGAAMLAGVALVDNEP
jgi:hypothetical protein